jgi:hypothetical protein
MSDLPIIELFPGVQFRRNPARPEGWQWEFEADGQWLIARHSYCDDTLLDHVADLVGAIEALQAAHGWITDSLPPDMHVVIMKFDGFWPGLGCGGIVDRYCYGGSWFNIPDTVTVTGWMYAPDNPPGTATDADDIPDFSPGNGNRARNRAAMLGIDMDASMKAGAITPLPAPWSEIAEPVADADRRCHDPECWCCDGTGRDPSGNAICVYNGGLPF